MKDTPLPLEICSQCVKCGTCQAACPVFGARPGEAYSARGKMAIIQAAAQSEVEETGLYRAYLENCLLCGACEEACPSEVPTLSAMLQAREGMASREGLKAGKGLILNHLLGTVRTFRMAMRAGRAFQPLMFRRIPESSGVRRRFPMPLVPGDRTLPEIAGDFFTDIYHGVVRDGPGPRVGIFAGCMVNYFYPQTGRTMVELLGDLGATVVVPEDQACCGMPALAGGARGTVRELAVRNLEVFEEHGLDVIVTGCASCGGSLKHNYGELLREAGVENSRIEAFTSNILDINEFLVQSMLEEQGKGEQAKVQEGDPFRVTYHHPCHLGRLQGVRDEPEKLIDSIPGVQLIPMADAHRCCGMGGSFSIEHYDISRRINDEKVDRIVGTGADAVITSCPACILHIRDGLIRNGHQGIRVLHVTELLTRTAKETVRPGHSTDETSAAALKQVPDDRTGGHP